MHVFRDSGVSAVLEHLDGTLSSCSHIHGGLWLLHSCAHEINYYLEKHPKFIMLIV